ncbi:MAG: hypothetical protein ABI968_07460, partial [Acidobacteriota bacterium]
MTVSVILIPILAASAAGIGAMARALGRSIPTPVLCLFTVLPILLFPGAFVSDRTPLPLDHAASIRPWNVLPHPAPRNANLNDVATQLLPWAQAVRVSWKDLSLPLRNRWNGCGTSLAANSQSAAYSPFTLLALLLPLVPGFTLLAALKLLFAMSGMWLWLRELQVSPRAAVFGSVTFAFSFAFTPWLFFPNATVMSLWSWILFLMELCRDPKRRAGATAALAGVFSIAALAGHPENVVLGCLFAGLWIAGRRIVGDLPELGAVTRATAVAATLALGLTAFCLLPSIWAIASSSSAVAAQTHPSAFWNPHGSVWRTGVLTPFFPHALGNAVESPDDKRVEAFVTVCAV